jgi:hypothetical protein
VQGEEVLRERAAAARTLHTRCQRVATMNDADVNALRSDIRAFVQATRAEEELGTTIRFTYEPDHIIQMLKTYGTGMCKRAKTFC